MASKQSQDSEEIEDELNDLDVNIKRLRIEYEQFFKGVLKREPQVLLGRVQKVITKFAADPPRRVALKFRYNSLVARFQSHRQLWHRIQRQIDAGTYEPHRFRMKAKAEPEATPEATPARKAEGPAGGGGAIDKLATALGAARKKAGQAGADVSREQVNAMVKKQTRAIREKYGKDVKVAFRVVVEDGKAKVKANVRKNAS